MSGGGCYGGGLAPCDKGRIDRGPFRNTTCESEETGINRWTVDCKDFFYRLSLLISYPRLESTSSQYRYTIEEIQKAKAKQKVKT